MLVLTICAQNTRSVSKPPGSSTSSSSSSSTSASSASLTKCFVCLSFTPRKHLLFFPSWPSFQPNHKPTTNLPTNLPTCLTYLNLPPTQLNPTNLPQPKPKPKPKKNYNPINPIKALQQKQNKNPKKNQPKPPQPSQARASVRGHHPPHPERRTELQRAQLLAPRDERRRRGAQRVTSEVQHRRDV